MGKVYILCLLTISSFVLGQKESKDDGNDRCTTDKNNPGYNKIYFPHWNKRVNRPKCDPKEDFGLTFKSTNNFQDCVYIEREWWAIQIMPIGFKPNFNGDFELRALTCKDKDGDESGSAVAHDIYKAHWAKMQKL